MKIKKCNIIVRKYNYFLISTRSVIIEGKGHLKDIKVGSLGIKKYREIYLPCKVENRYGYKFAYVIDYHSRFSDINDCIEYLKQYEN